MVVVNHAARSRAGVLSALHTVADVTESTSSGLELAHVETPHPPPVRLYPGDPRRRTRSRRGRSNRYERRIALFTGNYLSVTDGVSRTLQRLVDFLHSNGSRVLVVGPSDRRQVLNNAGPTYVEVPSIPMPGRPEYRISIGLPKTVCRQLDEFDADLVHIATPDLLGIGAMKFAETRQLPVVATYHTHFPSYLRFYHLDRMKKPLESYFRWFYSRCRHVYVPTPPVAEYFGDLGLRENVRLWGRGVDCVRFHPRHRSDLWRRQHSIGPDDILISYVGRLVKEKGMDVIQSVIQRTHALMPTARSIIVGDGPMREYLVNSLPNTIFTGHLEGAALATAYASSDVFLFPSASEAFGNVIVEAMASGLPVVCAGASGSSSHIVENESGLLANPGDADDFLSNVLRLVQNRDERMMMGLRARRHAESYDWTQTLNQLKQYYDEVYRAT